MPGDRQTAIINIPQVYYNYHCESEITTSVSVGYRSPVCGGNASLSLGDRKGYSGSCSTDGFCDIMEEVAFGLQKITAVSLAAGKDAREQRANACCDFNGADDKFPD